MISYTAFYLMALLFTILLMLAGSWVGSNIYHAGSKIVYTFMERRLFVMGYHSFYPNTNAVGKDEKCQPLLQTLRAVYSKDSNFNAYCTRISDERLPINVFMNWTRSVAEDVFTASMPSTKIDQWNHYFKSSLYHHISLFYSDFPEYDDREFGCLWGGIYYWLAVYFDKDMSDPLMNRVLYFGCKTKPGAPYFYHFYNEARNYKGYGYHLSFSSTSGEEVYEKGMASNEKFANTISAEEVLNGFEALSVNERCSARKVFNDVLADSAAWKSMCKEMKNRNWFKEPIYPFSNVTTIINGDNIEGDKVGEKKVFHRVDNYQPKIPNQTINFPEMPSGLLDLFQNIDE